MTPRAAPKLFRWFVLVTAILVCGLAVGTVEVVVVAFPLAVALACGVAAAEPVGVAVTWRVEPDRVFEGDEVDATLAVVDAPAGADVELAFRVPPEFTVVHGGARTATMFTRDGPNRVTLRLRAERWGHYELGTIGIRVRPPGGLLTFEDVQDLRSHVRVYPRLEPLRSGVRPGSTQVFSGNYVSRAARDGIEFAGVREYSRGDSVRRVNWRVTSRRGDLHVNVAHPERNADIVLWLDTFGDFGPTGRSSLDVTVRGALALARLHLGRRDRVAVVSFGGVVGWITAGAGRAHEVRVVDYLLGINPTPSWAWKDIDFLPPRTLPPLAVVVAFTPLVDRRGIEALIDLRGRGFPMVVVETLAEDAIPPEPSGEGRLAHRAWRLERAARRFDLGSLGIPVVRWSGEQPLEAALASGGPARIGSRLIDASARGAVLTARRGG